MEHLLLENRQAPGDLLVVSGAIRSLHAQHPGAFSTHVASTCPEIFAGNPLVAPGHPPSGRYLKVGYTLGISRSNQTRGHFAHGVTIDLASRVGVPVAVEDLRPHVTLGPGEGRLPSAPEHYWVMMAGGKSDFLTKLWGYSRWQRVVDILRGAVLFVQAGSSAPGGHQRRLTGVVDLVGRTSFREFLRLVAHSDGVACPVTCGMHAAAAFNRECVVVSGGREPWWWEAYTRETWEANCRAPVPDDFVPHRYLHTMGELPCCSRHGCWRAGMTAGGARSCVDIVAGVERVPRCMSLITPEQVAAAIMDAVSGVPVPAMPLPDWLGPLLPIPTHGASSVIPKEPPRTAAKFLQRNAEIENERPPVRNAPPMTPIRRMAVHGGGVLAALSPPVRICPDGMGAFAERDAVVAAAVVRTTPEGSVSFAAGTGWHVYLGRGVHPIGDGWLHLVAAAAGRGSRVVAGQHASWVAAAPEIAAGLNDGNWRRLLGASTRIRGVRMRGEMPGDLA